MTALTQHKEVCDVASIITRVAGYVVLIGALLTMGCPIGMTPPPVPDEYGLDVILVDGETGQPVEIGATVTATSGEYRTLLIRGESGAYTGAYLPGAYTIAVEAEGYQPAVVADVTVPALVAGDYAGLRTAFVFVDLTPLP